MKTRGLRKSPKSHLLKLQVSVSLITLCLTLPAFGQFKKFKKPSRFGNSPSQPEKNSFADDDSNKNTFGGRTATLPPMPDSKFVNLNPETAFGPEVVENFDFPDTDIMEMTNHMQKLTGINLILGKDVKGKVSITAPSPITVGDAWKAYLTALEMAGFTLVKSGAFYKIINARDVRYSPTKIYTGNYTPETDTHIMKVMALKNVDAAEISRNFRPFMSRYGRIIDLKQTNTVIVSDTGNNVARLEKLIKFLDVPGYEESLQIIPVKNTSASEIAKLIDEILQSGGSSSSSSSRSRRTSKRFSKASSSTESQQNISKIIAEPRTNSIIAMANSAGAEQLRNLINKLDVKFTSNNSGKIHVHYLNYGNAEELSQTLSTLVSGAAAQNSRTRTTGRAFIPSADGSTLFNGEVKITADKNNNALVVTAAPTDWLTIKSVISKLDIPRDQVYVEGLIMETTLTKVRGFGVNFVGAYGKGNAQRAGFVEGDDMFNLLSGNPTALRGFFAGSGGPNKSPTKFNIGGTDVMINSVNALIKAVASNTNSNVLATPQILALDNTEAEFEVGSTVPVRELTNAPNGTSTSNFRNQEAKLSLKITPQINKVSRFVKLKISQSINDFVGELDTSGNGQATTVRSANTEVMIRDRDTIAMGGLLRDKETVSVNKVPLLGDIPVLGWLFKSKNRRIDKINLLFFLTPRIISPYDKQAAANSLARLEARTKSLEEVIDEENDDPHKDKVKELTTKIEKQRNGPLYDTTPNPFQEENINSEGIGPATEDDDNVPNYQEIVEETQES